MHFVAGPAHESGFDEIVAHRPPPGRAPSRQLGERAVLHERRQPDDRVVAPEVTLLLLPEVSPGGEDRTVKRHGELLQPAPNRAAVDRLRNGLENPDAMIALHPPNEFDEGVRAHQTVGVEANHIAIQAPPAPAKIRDVAALAIERKLAPTIKNAPGAAGFGHGARQAASSASAFLRSVESLSTKN